MTSANAPIRPARVDDAAEMARLADELDYPMSTAEMTRRLAVLLSNERHHIAVATSDAGLLGWVHVEHRSSVEGGDRAELMGLVVDSTARRRGLGRELVAVAENWVLSKGLSSLTVRSNALRELSHPFYESLGYSREKTQHVYRKAITPAPASEPNGGFTKESSDAANVLFFPPGIPLITIVLGTVLQRLWPIGLGIELPPLVRYLLGGAIAIGAVLGLGLWSVLLFRAGGQNENPWKPTPHIEDRGPFRITRNPMYLQMLLVCIGVGIAFENAWLLILTPFAAWALQRLAIEPEEAYLERKFGAAYLAYKRRVRRWI